jgi:hypothetical protein
MIEGRESKGSKLTPELIEYQVIQIMVLELVFVNDVNPNFVGVMVALPSKKEFVKDLCFSKTWGVGPKYSINVNINDWRQICTLESLELARWGRPLVHDFCRRATR